jgi:hypothetical protein
LLPNKLQVSAVYLTTNTIMSRTNNTNAEVNRCLSKLATSTAQSAVTEFATNIGRQPNVHDPVQSSLYNSLQPRLFAGLRGSIAKRNVRTVQTATLSASRPEITALPTGVRVKAEGYINCTMLEVEQKNDGSLVRDAQGAPVLHEERGTLKPTATVDATWTENRGWSLRDVEVRIPNNGVGWQWM